MRGRWVFVSVVVLALLVPACKELEESSEEGGYEPATLQPIEGSDVSAVVLTEDAASRIDLQTSPVSTSPTGQLSMPYDAVFYGLDGETWAYVQSEPLIFVRTPVTVDSVSGATVYLSDGPAAGTEVVTVGAAELFGVETGVGT